MQLDGSLGASGPGVFRVICPCRATLRATGSPTSPSSHVPWQRTLRCSSGYVSTLSRILAYKRRILVGWPAHYRPRPLSAVEHRQRPTQGHHPPPAQESLACEWVAACSCSQERVWSSTCLMHSPTLVYRPIVFTLLNETCPIVLGN